MEQLLFHLHHEIPSKCGIKDTVFPPISDLPHLNSTAARLSPGHAAVSYPRLGPARASRTESDRPMCPEGLLQ